MSSANINTQAAAAREGARTGSGQFGHQKTGVASNAHDALPTPVDWNDVSAVGAHLTAADLHGELSAVKAEPH